MRIFKPDSNVQYGGNDDAIDIDPRFDRRLSGDGACRCRLLQGTEVGKYEYLNSCASCHGPAGKGDGPVAKALRRTPADLTKLSDANKGVFPFSRVYEVIDGRFEVETHGKRDMPVWGEVYKPTWSSGQSTIPPFFSKELAESIVRIRILALVEYISTLQAR